MRVSAGRKAVRLPSLWLPTCGGEGAWGRGWAVLTRRARCGVRIAGVGAWAPGGGKVMVEAPGRIETLVVEDDHDGERLDRALAAQVTALSRTRLKALVLAGRVAIGGRTIRDPGHHVNAGDRITLEVPPPEEATPQPEDIGLAIVHE